jgi:hypothetical protein
LLRVSCEQWHEGDETPHSWKDYYCQNPIVPTDFSSVRHAIKSATQAKSQSQSKSIRILCRPGIHHISKAITLVDSNLNVSVETLRLPQNLYQSALEAFTAQPTRAVLVQRRGTQYRNEPTIRVMNGANLSLTNIAIHHYSAGRDIWRGNAAIHVCAPESTEEREKPALVCLNEVEVTSSTGRGIVLAANGASLDIQNSCIHSCAATGLFIAGDHTTTRIDRTDIVFNGRGNISRGGAVPGHSGVYIEKGDLLVSNCNVSTNIGCGISVLSPDEANVKVEDSDVALNGIDALETSFRGYSHQHAWDQNSSSVHAGEERSRSNILRST